MGERYRHIVLHSEENTDTAAGALEKNRRTHSSSILVRPTWLVDFEADNRLLKGVSDLTRPAYILVSEKYATTNLKNEETSSKERFDSALLMGLILIRGVVLESLKDIVIVFDSLDVLKRFEELASSIEIYLEGQGRTPICCFNDGTVFRVQRIGGAPTRTKYDVHQTSVPFPWHSLVVPLALINETDLRGCQNKTLLYIKTESQRYPSGFPKLKSREERIIEYAGHRKLVVLAIGIKTLPKRITPKGYALFAQTGFEMPKLRFILKKPHPLSKDLVEINTDLKTTFASLLSLNEKLNCAMAVLNAISIEKSERYTDFNVHILRTSDNITVQTGLDNLCRRLNQVSRYEDKPLPKIKDWADMYLLLKDIEGKELTIEAYSEMKESANAIFGVLFADLIYSSELLEAEKQAATLDEVFKISDEVAKRVTNKIFVADDEPKITESTEFDPEEAVGYIALDYVPESGKTIVNAHQFILNRDSKRYTFYCQAESSSSIKLAEGKGTKPLSKLEIGDVIEKEYWEYQSLRASLLDYLNREGPEDSEILREYLSLSDSFRKDLERYALDTETEVLEAEFRELCSSSNLRAFLRAWVFETMHPTKQAMLTRVIKDINTAYHCEYTYEKLNKALSELKRKRNDLDDGEDKKSAVYEVIAGPTSIQVEADKLGKIFRLS